LTPNERGTNTRDKKNVERLGFSGDRRSIVNEAMATLRRLAIVTLTVAGWFSISNHCALAGLIERTAQPAMTQMHCHGGQQVPSKKGGDEQMPCCKLLRATLVTMAKSFTGHYASTFTITSYFVAPTAFRDRFPANASFELDTGPPFARSFAESVLQQSILAHAPPLSLS
jgi:hypothetical protein